MRIFTKWDKIVIGILLVISILPTIIITLAHKSGNNKEAIIEVHGKIVKEIQLKNLSKNQIYKFNFNGNTGYVETNNGKIRMLKMSRAICPKAICSETGWISESYQSIVCLPNSIIVTIKTLDNSNNDIDVISG